MVISGINQCPDLGADILFSGTAAAARQAAIIGIPAISVSIFSFNSPFYFENAGNFIVVNLDNFIEQWAPDHFLNINIPNRHQTEFEI